MELKFTKAVASGNDFVILDNRKNTLTDKIRDFSDFAKVICRRSFSVGADGLLVLEDSRLADFRMRIFNPDGSEVEMCGNGARCVALWAESKIKNLRQRQIPARRMAGGHLRRKTSQIQTSWRISG